MDAKTFEFSAIPKLKKLRTSDEFDPVTGQKVLKAEKLGRVVESVDAITGTVETRDEFPIILNPVAGAYPSGNALTISATFCEDLYDEVTVRDANGVMILDKDDKPVIERKLTKKPVRVLMTFTGWEEMKSRDDELRLHPQFNPPLFIRDDDMSFTQWRNELGDAKPVDYSPKEVGAVENKADKKSDKKSIENKAFK